MNWLSRGSMYNKSSFRRIIAHTWPKASELKDDCYKDVWHSMTRFEKLCWAWSRLNQYALNTIQKNPNAKLFYFEDIFISTERYKKLNELIDFATTFSDGTKFESKPVEGLLEKRIHASAGEFPSWPFWSDWHKSRFKEICGPFMNDLGYKLE